MPSQTHWDPTYFAHDPAPGVIILPPGQPAACSVAFAGGWPHKGGADFLEVTPPNAYDHAVIPLSYGTGGGAIHGDWPATPRSTGGLRMQSLTGSAAVSPGEHRPRPPPSAATRAERTEVIPGYRAIIDPAAVGLGFEVLVQVTMDREDASTIAGVERGLAAIPEIRHPERLLRDPTTWSGPPRGPRAAPATGSSHADHPDQRGHRSILGGYSR